MDKEAILKSIEDERSFLENKLNLLIKDIGKIPIANTTIMPYGWRKAAKGRTVWRILEEIISQNLEKNHKKYGFERVIPAESEVGVFDFEFCIEGGTRSYVNIKSAVIDGRVNKDDISKAPALIEFVENNPNKNLYVATFLISFDEDMTISLVKAVVFPTAWIPDIYINPSNNGNLQSKDYKNIENAVKRTNSEFLQALKDEYKVAINKKNKKKQEA